jgi:predicted permease
VLAALGAGRRQIVRRYLCEGIALTASAGALGVLLATLGVRALAALAPAELLALAEPRIDGAVLVFALVTSLSICIGMAVVPVLQLRGLDVQRELKDGRTTECGRVRLGLRRLLVAGQLGMAVVLLLGATLLIGTLENLRSVDPGFRAEGSLRFDFALPHTRYPSFDTYPNWPEIHDLLLALESEVAGVPGVTAVATVLSHPLEPASTNSFRIEGRAYDPTQGEMATRLITPGYFDAAGLEVVTGRPLAEADRLGTPDVIVINREAARRYFPDEDPIGQRIRFWGPVYREIVGVVENERILGLRAEPPPAMYATMLQSPPRGGKITLLVRSSVAPLLVVDAVRGAFRRVDAGIPVFNVATMEDTLADAVARERFASTALALFGGVATLLAVLGVHGVLAYLVAQRGHEVGIRMALGATRQDVVRLVLAQGAAMSALGIVAGLAAAWASSGVLRGLLFGVSPTDLSSYTLVASGLALVALAAMAMPAWRAASIDPVSSLKGE